MSRHQDTVTVGVGALSIEEVVAVARFGAQVEISAEALAEISATRERIEELAKDPTPVYGISTGFGALARRHIPEEMRAQLQRSEERRVGKECRTRGGAETEKRKKDETGRIGDLRMSARN